MSKILVIGDLILDEYIVGENYHISDEAPVPILKVDEFVPKLGGAANVANNIKSMGGEVLLCGCVGEVSKSRSASRFIKVVNDNGLSTSCIVQGDMRTTTKSRVIIKDQQVVRFDYEDCSLSNKMLIDLVERLKQLDFNEIDLIVVSDYKKGVITEEVMDILKSSKVKIIIDPKPGNDHLYNDVYCMTPNLGEFNKFTDSNFYKDKLDGIGEVANGYRKKLNLECLVVTLGEKGALCMIEDKGVIVGSREVEVANTIGAGDTFLSALCLKIAEGEELFESIRTANIASSIVVSKKYTGVCTMKEINKYRRENNE
jgi:D-beta-D-heptose 7-phosphate kinase/D-beta-D-heptose 1-phosphate adenosyltransferase